MRRWIRLFLHREILFAYDQGQWDAYNRVLHLLNTYDYIYIDKSRLYGAIHSMRPK